MAKPEYIQKNKAWLEEKSCEPGYGRLSQPGIPGGSTLVF